MVKKATFGVKKVKNSLSVVAILPFCRATMAQSYIFVAARLLICRQSFPYLSAVSYLFVGGRWWGVLSIRQLSVPI